jgi:hypothetical protein
MNTYYIRSHILEVSILLFIGLYVLLHVFQPGVLYDYSGALRQFGINQSNKTIFPAWLFAIVLSILSYLGILFYTAYPRIINKFINI